MLNISDQYICARINEGMAKIINTSRFCP